ncbi:hypothetical protein AX16_009016 [Volvariella volvacea WC 439]|nr:hypothetical protein AX16_009016 [Volvariella volvacea WC 439]
MLPSGLIYELLAHLFPYLDFQDLSNPRSSCTYLNQIFTPSLVDKLSLRLSSELYRLSSSSGKIPFIATPESFVAHIKRLSIELEVHRLDSPKDFLKDKNLVISLCTEIRRLRSLTHILICCNGNSELGWSPPKNPDRLGTLEVKLLGSALQTTQVPLEVLEIRNSFITPQLLSSSPVLKRITTLTELKIVYEEEGPGVFPFVKQLLTQSSSSLEKVSIGLYSYEPKLSLDDIFPPRSSEPLASLHTLDLYGSICSLPNSPIGALPYFPNLRHLTITRAHSTSELQENQSRLWDLLRVSHIRLESFGTTYETSDSLVKFLASFSGLQKLELDANTMRAIYTPPPDDISGIITRVLLLHASSLKTLIIPVPFPSFDYGSGKMVHWPSPTSFPLLTYLGARIPSGWDHTIEACQDLLGWLEEFPALIEADTPVWHINSSPTSREEDAALVSGKLVGRTGRPEIWNIYGHASLRWTFKSEPREYVGSVLGERWL